MKLDGMPQTPFVELSGVKGMAPLPSVKLDDKYRNSLIEFATSRDIPEEWLGTPIESFVAAQNFGWPIQTTGKPELLVASCIEFRYALPVPRMYAYVIRRASGRIIGSEFSVAYTMSKGVKHLVMIGHNDCGMSQLEANRAGVLQTLIDQGWSPEASEAYVAKNAERHAIVNELDALKGEYIRVRRLFPKLTIAPLFVCLYDSKLYLPKWYHEVEAQERLRPDTGVPDQMIADLP
jgi:carbonic anhydrase